MNNNLHILAYPVIKEGVLSGHP